MGLKYPHSGTGCVDVRMDLAPHVVLDLKGIGKRDGTPSLPQRKWLQVGERGIDGEFCPEDG